MFVEFHPSRLLKCLIQGWCEYWISINNCWHWSIVQIKDRRWERPDRECWWNDTCRWWLDWKGIRDSRSRKWALRERSSFSSERRVITWYIWYFSVRDHGLLLLIVPEYSETSPRNWSGSEIWSWSIIVVLYCKVTMVVNLSFSLTLKRG